MKINKVMLPAQVELRWMENSIKLDLMTLKSRLRGTSAAKN